MPKSTSPIKAEDLPSASAKAKFFYKGVFTLTRKREEVSPPKQGKSTSQDKKSTSQDRKSPKK
jgi:hypothetical protein